MQIPHSSSGIANFLTLSIGVATIIPNQPDNDDLLRLPADKALYLGKEYGEEPGKAGRC